MQFMKRLLYPIRKAAARFVDVHGVDTLGLVAKVDAQITILAKLPSEAIIYKAACILAAEKVEGDYLEFGVFSGRSFIQAYHVLKTEYELQCIVGPGKTEKDAREIRQAWEVMRFFAFDSFQGLPDLDGIDTQGADFTAGKYAYSEQDFCANLTAAGVPLERVTTVPGWFEDTCIPETIKRLGLQKAAVVHIDGDLYSSAKTALTFVTPLLQDGTVIIFDDWYSFRGNPKRGEQRAFADWQDSLPQWTFTQFQKEGSSRNSFIANLIERDE